MDLPNPKTAAARLKKISQLRLTLVIVLGSGFHHALTELRVAKNISYAKIPGFPKPTVSGHANCISATLAGRAQTKLLSSAFVITP